MDTVTYEGEEIPLTVQYSERRRSLGITVKQTGEVVVRAPSYFSREKILAFAQSKAAWIAKHRTRFLSREVCQRTYTDGETIPFFGRNLTVSRVEGNCLKANIAGDSLIVTVPSSLTEEETVLGLRDAVTYLFRREGLNALKPAVQHYAELLGIEAPPVRIRIQTAKWGCCTPKNGIILNVKILLAPPVVAEYLIVHELAHIPHRNHQAEFWEEVERLMPNYRDAEALLKSDGWRWTF